MPISEESHKLQVFTNIMPGQVCEAKKYEIQEQFRILHKEEHRNLHRSLLR
jgi:hypothetical protein